MESNRSKCVLKQHNQWLFWRFEQGRKIPVNKWGEPSGSTRTDDYMSWEEAKEIDDNRRIIVQGPAFCFTKGDPHLVILGSSTPGRLWEGLSPENVSDGLLGRCMLFDVTESPPLRQDSGNGDIPAEIVGFANAWWTANPGGGNLRPEPCVAQYEHAARQRFDEHERDIYPPAEKAKKFPLCLEGERACPPEDVGGPWGYAEFLETLADPSHEGHDEMVEWIGPFDAEAFSVEEATKAMQTGLPKF